VTLLQQRAQWQGLCPAIFAVGAKLHVPDEEIGRSPGTGRFRGLRVGRPTGDLGSNRAKWALVTSPDLMQVFAA
jgi:hypothetical protein